MRIFVADEILPHYNFRYCTRSALFLLVTRGLHETRQRKHSLHCRSSHTPPEDRRARSSGAGCGYIRATREILPHYNFRYCNRSALFLLVTRGLHKTRQCKRMLALPEFAYPTRRSETSLSRRRVWVYSPQAKFSRITTLDTAIAVRFCYW